MYTDLDKLTGHHYTLFATQKGTTIGSELVYSLGTKGKLKMCNNMIGQDTLSIDGEVIKLAYN